MRICFFCEKIIDSEQKKRMIPVERPYINLWFHLDCLSEINNMKDYLNDNIDKLNEFLKKQSKMNKK